MKIWELKKGDKARHGENGELLIFNKMDGMYAQWINERGELEDGHTDNYELGKDGIYIG